MLDDVAAQDLSDIDMFVPGLVVDGHQPTQPQFQLRGIRTDDFGIGTDPGVMMPELGRSLVHTEGVELIRQWIAEQEGKCEEAG